MQKKYKDNEIDHWLKCVLMFNRELLKESVSRLEMELNESNHKLELSVATNRLKIAKLEAELKQACINKLRVGES